MAVPVRRRSAPSADDYAPAAPAAAEPNTERRSRRDRTAVMEPVMVPKHDPEFLDGLYDAALLTLADEEGIDSSIEDINEVFDALVALQVPLVAVPAPEPEVAAEEPTRRRGRVAAAAPERTDEAESGGMQRKARPGMKAFAKQQARASTYERPWKPTEDESIVLFLEDEPFDSYAEHNLFRTPADKGTGQRTFVCFADDADCDLCDVGNDVKAKAVFNIVVIDAETGDAAFQVLEAGPGLTKEIAKKQKSKLTSRLSDGYWSMYGVKKGNTSIIEYEFNHVDTDELSKVYGIPPLTEDQVTAFSAKKKKDDYIKYPSASAVKEAAELLANG